MILFSDLDVEDPGRSGVIVVVLFMFVVIIVRKLHLHRLDGWSGVGGSWSRVGRFGL